MKTNRSNLIWGIALILTGAASLANELGYLRGFSVFSWELIFAAASLLFLISYFFNGFQAWGWLFPASIFAALSGTMAVSGVAILAIWIPTKILGAVALPFLAAFLLNRSRMWALLLAFILGIIAFIPPLSTLLQGELLGAFIVGAIGLPFLAAWLVTPRAWWGIIPGGVMISIALMIALVPTLPNGASVPVMFAGWAVTFWLVWKRNGLAWARIPTGVMLTLTCIMLMVTSGLRNYWGYRLILAGIVLVFTSWVRRPKLEMN